MPPRSNPSYANRQHPLRVNALSTVSCDGGCKTAPGTVSNAKGSPLHRGQSLHQETSSNTEGNPLRRG
jgi:hypothetical protein